MGEKQLPARPSVDLPRLPDHFNPGIGRPLNRMGRKHSKLDEVAPHPFNGVLCQRAGAIVVFGTAAEGRGAGGDDGDAGAESLDGYSGENGLMGIVLSAGVAKAVVASEAVDGRALSESEGVPELIIAEARLLFIFESELHFGLVEAECFEHEVRVDV